jgi:hypothetical protein
MTNAIRMNNVPRKGPERWPSGGQSLAQAPSGIPLDRHASSGPFPAAPADRLPFEDLLAQLAREIPLGSLRGLL